MKLDLLQAEIQIASQKIARLIDAIHHVDAAHYLVFEHTYRQDGMIVWKPKTKGNEKYGFSVSIPEKFYDTDDIDGLKAWWSEELRKKEEHATKQAEGYKNFRDKIEEKLPKLESHEEIKAAIKILEDRLSSKKS
jgi:hypothetical protein